MNTMLCSTNLKVASLSFVLGTGRNGPNIHPVAKWVTGMNNGMMTFTLCVPIIAAESCSAAHGENMV